MDSLLKFLRTRGMQRGVQGNSRTWLAVWIAITLGRQLNKRLGKDSVVVERIVLKPGQTVQVVDTGIAWKDDREVSAATAAKADAKAAAKQGRGRRGRRSTT